jgi:hypothetical protein
MTIWCNRCSQMKDGAEFYNDKKRKTKKTVYCKSCTNAARKKWGEKNPQAESELRRACKYGLLRKELEVLLQVPVCQACGGHLQSDHATKIDHCHENGHIRGVLCHLCNLACAGLTQESIVRLQKCRSYLMRELERVSEQEGTGAVTNVAS